MGAAPRADAACRLKEQDLWLALALVPLAAGRKALAQPAATPLGIWWLCQPRSHAAAAHPLGPGPDDNELLTLEIIHQFVEVSRAGPCRRC